MHRMHGSSALSYKRLLRSLERCRPLDQLGEATSQRPQDDVVGEDSKDLKREGD
jgi:hypothetical protein